MISTRRLIYYLYVGIICHALMLTACQPPIVGPTKPSGYRIVVPSTLQTTLWQSLTLSVQVTDANGAPVSDVPVTFHLVQPHAAVAELEPLSVRTQQGKATTTLQAKAAGYVMVDVTVENITKTIYITIVGETPRF